MAPARVAVAYSGGRDSTALLHATLRAAAPLGVQVVALHVHHGLSPNADAWLERCRATCEAWAKNGEPLRFAAQRVAGAPARGESVEAWARKARYDALHELAVKHGAGLVLLAQHRRDQAETVLLQALRGAGVAGLAGMPRVIARDGVTWARPWLGYPRTAIEAYVETHGLEPLEDESNDDPRFARNRLRLQVWPTLVDAFPHAEASIATAAAWAQEASSALGELAALDLTLVAPRGPLQIDPWQMLSPARRSNALRAWLRGQTGASASATLVARLSNELPSARSGRWLVAGGELRSHRAQLMWLPASQRAPSRVAAPEGATLRIPRGGLYRLPEWGGALKVTRALEGGVALDALERVDLCSRRGAEQFQAGPGRPARSLKKQYQAAGVPEWQRQGPLVYGAGRLLFVPGLGIDARALARPGERQMSLDWIAATDTDASEGRGAAG